LFAAAVSLACSTAAPAQPAQVNTIGDVYERLRTCWKPPPPSLVHPDIDTTVIVSFNRSGQILGHPRITVVTRATVTAIVATDSGRAVERVEQSA